jgi:hypothetical protein
MQNVPTAATAYVKLAPIGMLASAPLTVRLGASAVTMAQRIPVPGADVVNAGRQ